ncbi:DUF6928 family protein [Paractinoplanes brasiliensis]|uniref:Uncharacterized protein n=1 Tax=Paractinoplanes brasiliensis TaxID=52695 RepID=A0A4R6JPM9_9ACTN|nr:hypothetical protein [Actinoplanes brasiliensis]TDO37331.1 hypothetical protein C8E87_0945 [Actinoplanes brasiliensis]GID29354.1 hypothetical protein Abr02nite_43370 [Actinoplanes brasiliensis]
MGAKTAILAFTDGDLRQVLPGPAAPDPGPAEALLHKIFPGYAVTPAGVSTLDVTYPPEDVAHVAVLAGAELVCDQRLVLDRPSELPEHLIEAGAGRRIVLHGMHSVVDWLGFAVWEDGKLVRSLSLSPDGGIEENIGEPYEFERPYWAGEHPVEPMFPDQGPYPLPFHPLELGEEALRALFGFTIEGRREPADIDPDDVPVHVFRVTDPSGKEQETREAAAEQIRSGLGPLRIYQRGPDGDLREVSWNEFERQHPPDQF